MIENITLKKAQLKDKELLKNLFQFHLHDLSEFAETLNVNSYGKFDNNDVEIFFELENAISMTININDEIIGFVFLIKSKAVDFIVNDIFILRKYRRRGIGKTVVNQLFKLFSGKYGLIILIKNKPSLLFWYNVLDENKIAYKESNDFYDEEECVKIIFSI